MGKATIVSGGDGGKYQVRLDYGKAAQTERLAAIAARLAALVGLIAQALQDLNTQEYTGAQAEAQVETAINAYVAATHALAALPLDTEPAVLSALQGVVKTALQTHTEALKKLAEVVRKTGPLRLAWQALKAEQVQLQKDQAKWAALVLDETVQAWCADLTEFAAGEVATVEIPGEDKLVLIAPAAPAPTAAYGVLAAREVQTPAQVFFNAAILPGWQKYMPTYRRGVVTAVDEANDKADVTLESADKSSAQNLGINQAGTLTAVPVEYMTCNAGAFTVGDKCIVRFDQQDWARPRVVGFVDNPKSCALVLSGVVRDGGLTLLPVPPGSPPNTVGKMALSSFKPTANCWQYPLRSDPAKNPNAFHNETRLAGAGAQYQNLSASSFSGRMAQVVQVVMGRGLPVVYNSAALHCHGVVTAADGKPWLVEISAANGVVAMRLPVDRGSPNSPEDVVRESVALWGGVPNGKPMPAGAALDAALAAGTVIRLATTADLAPYTGKSMHAAHLGWSFNAAGSEAHNTCWDAGAGGIDATYHYRLNLSIGALVDEPAPGEPLATGTAMMTLMESGPFYKIGFDTALAPIIPMSPFAFADVATGGVLPIVGGKKVDINSMPDHASPVFVCHINDVLEVVKIRFYKYRSVTNIPYQLVVTAGSNIQFVSSNTFPYEGGTSTSTQGGPAGASTNFFPYPGGEYFDLRTCVVFAGGLRDGYVHFKNGTLSNSSPDPNTISTGSVTKAVVTVLTSAGAKYEQDILGAGTYIRGGPDDPSYGYDPNSPGNWLRTVWDIQEEMWQNPSNVAATFVVRCSAFGQAPQAAFSRHIGGGDTVLRGTLVAAEPVPTQIKYNFVGYL